LKLTGDGHDGRGFPRWLIFAPWISLLAIFFTGVEATGSLGRDVVRDMLYRYYCHH